MDLEQKHKDLVKWNHFKNGDKSAYAQIYKEYFHILYDYGFKIAKDEAITKDSIQNLFVKLWRNRENLGIPGSVKQYLFKSLRRIIVREISDKRVDQLKEEENYESFNFQIVVSKETELVENQRRIEIREELENALQNLTQRQKEAIYLKFYNKMGYDEIAEVMGLDKNSVYNLIAKSIKLLRKNSHKINLSLIALVILFLSL